MRDEKKKKKKKLIFDSQLLLLLLLFLNSELWDTLNDYWVIGCYSYEFGNWFILGFLYRSV